MASSLIEPHGGSLVELLASEESAAELRVESASWPSGHLGYRKLCDHAGWAGRHE